MEINGVAEQLVTKAPSPSDGLKRALIGGVTVILAASVLLFSSLLALPPLGVLLAAVISWGGYRLFTGTFIEYEYSVFDGELDIDKIIAKRRRVSMITVKISSFDRYAEASSAGDDEPPTCVCAAGDEGEQWYADFIHPEHGKTRLYFTPNEKLREALKRFLPRNKGFKV